MKSFASSLNTELRLTWAIHSIKAIVLDPELVV